MTFRCICLFYRRKRKKNLISNALQPSLFQDKGQRRHTLATSNPQSDPKISGAAGGAVSLITALFPSAGTEVKTRQDQMESDFMFALFIQEQEQASCNGPSPGALPQRLRHVDQGHLVSAVGSGGGIRSGGRLRHQTTVMTEIKIKKSAPRPPIPRPDPNDPEVGHFCAPFCPGFCEANFCVLHAQTK